MPKKKAKGERARPPRKPPTAIGTIPPGGDEASPVPPSAPGTRTIVSFTGAPGTGKSTLARNLAAAWAGARGRKVLVARIGAKGPAEPLDRVKFDDWGVGAFSFGVTRLSPGHQAAALRTASEAYDVFIEVDEGFEGRDRFFEISSQVFWVVPPSPKECGVVAAQLARYAGVGPSMPPFDVVVNQVAAKRSASEEEVADSCRRRSLHRLASFPYDARFPGFAKEGKIAAVEDVACPWVGELRVLLGRLISAENAGREAEIASAISRKYGIPYASLENQVLKIEPGQNLDALVPERFAREHVVAPLFVDNKVLAVALADPDAVFVLDDLKAMTGLSIQPFVGTKTQILQVIADFYR